MCVTNSLELIVIKISLRCVSKLPRVKKEMEELQSKMVRDQARVKRVYNPANLQLGGPQLLEAMKDFLKNYKTCQQYLVRAKEIITWYEAFFSTSDTVFHMDSLLYIMESNVVPPGIEEMLEQIPDKKKHKHLINSYKAMMQVSE